MEVMEDGNLMDKVHILIQRDMEYYKNKQSVLQESICPGIVGGRLDFPLYASFAAIKLVLWWEEEFVAAYRRSSGFMQTCDESLDRNLETTGGCGGIVKASDPQKFTSSVTKSSEQLMEHLHVLTQEALDHADLSVLTGTIGAAALIKNSLWCYIQTTSLEKPNLSDQLQPSHKKYREMGEALAERLLDLHCRLLSLYILQDAESLDWESSKPFFESERGSYVIQMWWLYMQGTRQDLWNTVPPKMAQRVFSGMLNETLTILTVRYTQAPCSEARSQLLAVDISNLLLCVAQLLPAICNNADELIGVCLNSQSKILRDVHAKCQELLTCLILRGTPLDVLYKVFRKGIDSAEVFRSRSNTLSPWIVFGLPHIYREWPKNVTKLSDLPSNIAISLELLVLLAQPQPSWSLLLKVLCMRECKILKLILYEAFDRFSKVKDFTRTQAQAAKCNGFLCMGDGVCKGVEATSNFLTSQQYYDLILSATSVVLSVGNAKDYADVLLDTVDKTERWAQCFDRREVWNQKRPPWFEAIIDLVKPILPPITKTVTSAVQTGASMYQAMSIVLACFSQLWDCSNPAVPQIAVLVQDLLPANVTAMAKSTLLQLLLSALYTDLLKRSEELSKKFEAKKGVKFFECGDKEMTATSVQKSPHKEKDPLAHKNSICSFDGTVSSEDAIALAVAEALCSIDEDNKHTEQIDEFLAQVKQSLETDHVLTDGCKRVEQSQQMVEILVSDLLMTNAGKKSLKVLHHFIRNNSEWLFQKLGVSEINESFDPNKATSPPDQLLHIMFHIGYRPFDQLFSDWQPDWLSLLHTPMGLSLDRVWSQISLRWEFKEANSSCLSTHDAHIVSTLTSVLKPS